MISKKYLYSTANRGRIKITNLNRLSLMYVRKMPFTNIYMALSGRRRNQLIRKRMFSNKSKE